VKAFVIVVLSLEIVSEMGTIGRGVTSEEVPVVIGGFVRFVACILALIFVAIAM
jgi:hypothetical protein